MEFSLLWAALTGVAFTWAGTRLWNDRLPDHPLDRMIGAAGAGLLVGRLVAMVSQGTNPLAHPADILLVRGGVHTAAAASGAILAFVWSVRGEIKFLDAIAPAAVLGLSGWHAGCLWRSACLGIAGDLPWAWSVSGSEVTRHPVEIYAAVGFAISAIVVSRLPWPLLLRAGGALTLSSLVLLFTEPLRLTIGDGVHSWYLAGAIAGGLVVVVALVRTRSRTFQLS